MTITEAFRIALESHQSGRLAEAESLYRQILAADPRHADALHLLGVVAHQVGRHDAAVDLIRQAIAAAPGDAHVYYSNLGEAYRAAGQFDEAVAACREAIALSPNFSAAYNSLGNAFSGKGEQDEAIAAYRHAIDLTPDYPEALGGLGNALYGSGRLDEAIEAYRRAIDLRPGAADAHGNLGNALYRAGRMDEAIAAYRHAVTLAPGVAHLFSNLGEAYRAAGQVDDAIEAYRQAVALDPSFAAAFTRLGNALFDRGRMDEALAAYGQAIAVEPGDPETHNSLGNALYRLGRLDEAVAAYRQAVSLARGLAHVYYANLGEAYRAAGRLDLAEDACRQAIAIEPNDPEAHLNLGNALLDGGKLDAALAACRQAIDLKPAFHEAYNVIGVALLESGKLDEAIAAYRQAIALRPDYAKAHSNLGNALKDKGQVGEALDCYRRAIALQPDFADAHSNLLYSLNFHADCDAQAIVRENREWNRRFGEPLREFIRPHDNDRDPKRRLRIGYVSPHFRDHCQSFFTVPLLSRHDHRNFEVFCYANVGRPDEVTERLRGFADIWQNCVGLSDPDMADLIRADRIDVLVDLTMHMQGCRLQLFARKPAPVQIAWLAYPGSTGLDAMDFRLTDPWLDPPGSSDTGSSETPICLPETFWCYDPLADEPRVNSLPAREAGHVTFGSLNNYCKVNERTIELWSNVLRAVAGSRLLLLAKPGDHRSRALDAFERHGVGRDRIEWFTPAPRAEYLAAYRRVDLGLDPIPYNGHTTSLDSFWMGVPVITMVGNTAVGRGGLSQAMNLGLPELIAQTPDDYVDRAVAFASNLPRLAELRRTLRSRMEASPLMEAGRFARNVESAYRTAWRMWCAASNRGM